MPRRHDDVVRSLVDDVVSGSLAEGETLPPEHELALRYGAGRGVVREALRTLEARGLLESGAGRGVLVRPSDRWPLGDPCVLVPLLRRGDDQELLQELLEAWAELGRHAAQAAARRATAGDRELLRGRLILLDQALSRPGDGRSAIDQEMAFHHAFALIAGNRVRARVLMRLHEAVATLRVTRSPDRGSAVLRHHRHLLEGISSRDADMAADAVDAYGRALMRWLTPAR